MVTTEPRVSDVAGRYTFSHSKFGSRVDAEILSSAKEAYIDLKTNGEVVLHKVPIIPESRSQGFGIDEFRSGSGTYKIAALGSTAKSDFYGLYLTVGTLPDPMGHPRFTQKDQSLSLSFEYFDGDFTDKPGLMLIPPGDREILTLRIRLC